MKPWLDVDGVTVFHGDCIEVMRQMPDNSVDAVVTDPPYELSFLNRNWDGTGVAFQIETWAEALRVLKPGGHLLAFGGTRTWHRLAVAIEDAGFEIRDSVMWLYGSGFPKSHDVSKAIDKRAGAKRLVMKKKRVKSGGMESLNKTNADQHAYRPNGYQKGENILDITAPATDSAKQWQGWGTALKPAHEPIVVARKPLIGTVAENVLTHGTGALNIDGCRIAHGDDVDLTAVQRQQQDNEWGGVARSAMGKEVAKYKPAGRWPANVILDESQAAELDKQSGVQRDSVVVRRNGTKGTGLFPVKIAVGSSDVRFSGGGASRFFYVAKASKKERPNVDGIAHPTVKPITLMRYLVRLVTPPGGTVLEPFAGSGTTIEACVIEGFHCIAIEREANYLPLIEARLNRPIQGAM